jgi:hypothetical protein
MNPAGFTAGIVALGRSGELNERCVVAVGAGTGGLLITDPPDVLAVGVGVAVEVADGVVEETAGWANSFCTWPLANATTMISASTSMAETPMMTPV